MQTDMHTPVDNRQQAELITENEHNCEEVAGDGRYEKPSPLLMPTGTASLDAGDFIADEADSFTTAHNFLKEVKAAASLPNLNTAIRLLQSAAYNWPPAKSGRSECLHHLATALLIRFILAPDGNDVQNAVSLRGGALGRVSQNAFQQTLAWMLRDRFFPTSETSKLDSALLCYQEALCTLKGGVEQWMVFWELSEALIIKFYLTGNGPIYVQQSKFNRTIGLCAALVTANSKFRPPEHLKEAADLYLEIREKDDEAEKLVEIVGLPLGQELPLDAAIEEAEVDLLSDQDSSLDVTIEVCQVVESLLSWGNRQRAVTLEYLGNLLETRFEQSKDPKDIRDAIQLYREALDLCVFPHPNHSMLLYHLAHALDTRYELNGDLDDINEAIKLQRRSLELRPSPHPNRIESLVHLGIEMCRLYERRGDTTHSEEAIRLLREALELCPSPPRRATILDTLAVALRTRYIRRGNPNDIDEAIRLQREALKLRESPNLRRDSSLNNLAGAIQTRYQNHTQRVPKDINEAIQLYREAVELCGSESSHLDGQSMFLNNLAGAIHERYEHEPDRNDIDEAINLHRDSLKLRPSPHPLRSTSLHNLAEAIHTRFKRMGDSTDIYEVIQLHEDALALRSPPHPERSTSLSGLADVIETLSRHKQNSSGIYKVIALRKEAIAYASTPPLTRFSESLNWARISDEYGHESRLDAHHSCINLLPQLAAFDLDLKSRRQILTRTNITSVASDSAACAMSLGKNDVAVEFLEASRSIFWAQALQLRAPLEHLEKLREISRELEQGSFRDTSHNTDSISQQHIMSIEAVGEKWTETVEAVRNMRGFEDFLRPKGIASLKQAAQSGPVVILFAAHSTASALIVTASDDVQCVPLPRINRPAQLSKHSRVNLNTFIEKHSTSWFDHSKMVSFDEFLNTLLGILWSDVVEPIFHFLKIQKSAQPSRLWWCPTGPFAFLPIHAAGKYDQDSADFASQYVISSYAPTLTTLLNTPTHTTASFKMTVAIEPEAPGCSVLPGTKAELDKITRHVPTTWLTALHRPTGTQVLRQLAKSSVVHFACHGVQDASEPLHSGLMLSDGRLKVLEIMKEDDRDTDSRKRGMSLAFLSACETATGDRATPDEVMHLAASLMFAGFHSVVATMWTIQDLDGPKVADGFYEHLFKECAANFTPPILPDLKKSAEALHLAVDKLRREPGMSLRRWVPFVHYGL
ncbi:CHAT domain-containing protein [Mycena leptocephala]|nr:CHAT domain-containing protein [Mycena leptocephala]